MTLGWNPWNLMAKLKKKYTFIFLIQKTFFLSFYFANGLNLGRIHAAANVVPGETTFDQFLIEKFGEKATAMLHRPLYNKKFSFPTTQIPSSYNEALLTKPSEKTVVVENDETKSDAPVGDEFLYPKQGGYSNFWKAIAKSLPTEKLHFKTEITSIGIGLNNHQKFFELL